MLAQQLDILQDVPRPKLRSEYERIPLTAYDRILLAFSGGKDSLACVLHLLDLGIDPSVIELHHHRVDGDTEYGLFDWPCTDAYVRAFAQAFGLNLFFSWREGGLEREMLRENALTAPIVFQTPDGVVEKVGGTRGEPNTRLMYPQVSADLRVRWCSGKAKIDVMDGLIRNSSRFEQGKTLVITGERAEESPNRARYRVFEPHRADLRAPKKDSTNPRWVDHFRPIHAWSQAEVWKIIQAWGVIPHAAYFLNFGRVSCQTCIFLSDQAWATLHRIDPTKVERHMAYEERFGTTIHRTRSLRDRITGQQATEDLDPEWVAQALSTRWERPIRIDSEKWILPCGAFGESTGPS